MIVGATWLHPISSFINPSLETIGVDFQSSDMDISNRIYIKNNLI